MHVLAIQKLQTDSHFKLDFFGDWPPCIPDAARVPEQGWRGPVEGAGAPD